MSVKSRKGNRKGFAGDDVTDNKDYIEEVVPKEDDSYVVKGTDSDDYIETESEIIDDQHNVIIIESDQGMEEEFMAESEDGEAEVIEDDGGESREGSRKGESDDEIEEDIEELEEDLEDREGSRKVARRGSRRGDTVDVITDEQGNTEHVELPEPDEREGARKGSVYGGRSPEHQESIRAAVAVAMKDRRL